MIVSCHQCGTRFRHRKAPVNPPQVGRCGQCHHSVVLKQARAFYRVVSPVPSTAGMPGGIGMDDPTLAAPLAAATGQSPLIPPSASVSSSARPVARDLGEARVQGPSSADGVSAESDLSIDYPQDLQLDLPEAVVAAASQAGPTSQAGSTSQAGPTEQREQPQADSLATDCAPTEESAVEDVWTLDDDSIDATEEKAGPEATADDSEPTAAGASSRPAVESFQLDAPEDPSNVEAFLDAEDDPFGASQAVEMSAEEALASLEAEKGSSQLAPDSLDDEEEAYDLSSARPEPIEETGDEPSANVAPVVGAPESEESVFAGPAIEVDEEDDLFGSVDPARLDESFDASGRAGLEETEAVEPSVDAEQDADAETDQQAPRTSPIAAIGATVVPTAGLGAAGWFTAPLQQLDPMMGAGAGAVLGLLVSWGLVRWLSKKS